jgi:flagellar hook protein FlgE
MSFSPITGNLTSGGSLALTVPGGQSMTLNMGGMTQLAGAFSVTTSTVNGNAPAAVSSVSIGTDGTLSYQLTNGSTVNAYKIPLADVPSPDNLLSQTGNVFSPNILSGQPSVGTAGTGQLGAIKSSELEQSTVDIATELTNMIVAQRGYQANSQMFKAGADLMSTLIQMNLT